MHTWLKVCTVGTFDTDVANKLIKIMFSKYFKIPRWHFPPNFNKNNFNFNFTILKMKNKNRNLRFSLHLLVLSWHPNTKIQILDQYINTNPFHLRPPLKFKPVVTPHNLNYKCKQPRLQPIDPLSDITKPILRPENPTRQLELRLPD